MSCQPGCGSAGPSNASEVVRIASCQPCVIETNEAEDRVWHERLSSRVESPCHICGDSSRDARGTILGRRLHDRDTHMDRSITSHSQPHTPRRLRFRRLGAALMVVGRSGAFLAWNTSRNRDVASCRQALPSQHAARREVRRGFRPAPAACGDRRDLPPAPDGPFR